MATVTSTAVANREVRAVHAGANAIYVELSSTATLTDGSIVQLALLPDRARVVDGWVKLPSDQVVSLGTFDISGTAVDTQFFISSADVADNALQRLFNTGTAVTNAGAQISISHTQIQKYRIVGLTVDSSTGTASGKYALHMLYYMDGEETAT